MKAGSVAFAIFLFAGCATEPPEAPLVEIGELLATPDRYDGQLVRVRGAAVVRFEANFICPKAELIDSDSGKGCLWLTPGAVGDKAYDIRAFHRKTVEIVGRFDPTRFGHMGAYGGTIAVTSGKVTGTHGKGDIPPPPPPPPGSSANNSSKPTPLRGAA